MPRQSTFRGGTFRPSQFNDGSFAGRSTAGGPVRLQVASVLGSQSRFASVGDRAKQH
jgi:hypothetical protein